MTAKKEIKKKKPTGRPTKYKEEYVERLIELGKGRLSRIKSWFSEYQKLVSHAER